MHQEASDTNHKFFGRSRCRSLALELTRSQSSFISCWTLRALQGMQMLNSNNRELLSDVPSTRRHASTTHSVMPVSLANAAREAARVTGHNLLVIPSMTGSQPRVNTRRRSTMSDAFSTLENHDCCPRFYPLSEMLYQNMEHPCLDMVPYPSGRLTRDWVLRPPLSDLHGSACVPVCVGIR